MTGLRIRKETRAQIPDREFMLAVDIERFGVAVKLGGPAVDFLFLLLCVLVVKKIRYARCCSRSSSFCLRSTPQR
jgi:hypothetical protein